jgi:hypothetical protein
VHKLTDEKLCKTNKPSNYDYFSHQKIAFPIPLDGKRVKNEKNTTTKRAAGEKMAIDSP